MRRVVKYPILLSCILVSNLAFSQKRNVVVNTESVSRSVIVMDTTTNKNKSDIWTLLEQERIAAEKAGQERIATEKAEQERIAAEKAEQERIAAEKAEQERIAAEKAEQARIEAEKKAEQERIAAEKAEQERIAAEKKAEQERIAAEKAEQARIEAEKKAEQERIAAEKAEQERIAAEKKAEQERIAAEKKEAAKKKYNEYLQNATIKTLIMGEVGYTTTPQLSYGAMFAQMYKGVGWFVSGRSNFNFITPADVVCDATGSIDGVVPFYTGKTSTMHFLVNGGLMVNFLEWSSTNKFNTFGMYIGAGYGLREYQLETTHGIKVKYAPTSPNGVSGTVGLFGSIYGLTLNVGVSTIAFKNLEVEVGIGYMF